MNNPPHALDDMSVTSPAPFAPPREASEADESTSGSRDSGSTGSTDEIDLRTPAADLAPPADAVDTLPDVDAIVLDIDDTLYLERDYVRSGFTAVDRWARHELGIEDFGDRAWATFEAGTRNTIFDDVLVGCGRRADDAVVTELVARYRTHAPSIALQPDAYEALERWRSAVISLAAITDGPLASQQAKARALALDRWVDPVIYTAKLGHGKGKPDPAAFELAQEVLGVDGKRCVYIADNPAKDFTGPKSLGWRTVRVRRPESLHADVESGDDVDHEVGSLAQVDRVLSGR